MAFLGPSAILTLRSRMFEVSPVTVSTGWFGYLGERHGYRYVFEFVNASKSEYRYGTPRPKEYDADVRSSWSP